MVSNSRMITLPVATIDDGNLRMMMTVTDVQSHSVRPLHPYISILRD